MGQPAGDFYVNLGLKGADKTISDIGRTKDGFSDLKSMSIEAKVAMVAALAVLTDIIAKSEQKGTTLTNFSAISGVSLETLQRYQYASIQAHVSEDSMASSFLKMQRTGMDIMAGLGPPKWLPAIITSLAQHGQNVGSDFAQKWANRPDIGFQAMQKYAALQDIPVSTRVYTLEQAGFSQDLITAWMRKSLTPAALAAVPSSAIVSAKDAENLDKGRATVESNLRWLESLGNKFSSLLVGSGKSPEEFYRALKKSGISEADAIKHIPYTKSNPEYKIAIHQIVNVYGNASPAQVKKAAHDGTSDASKGISTSLSAQTGQ